MRRFAQALLFVAAASLPAAAFFHADPVSARVAYDSPYSYEQTFGTALRLLRVDLGLTVTEKDADAGYVLFEYKSPESGNRVSNGAIEMVRAERQVHVAVQIPAMPSYHEQMVIDQLSKKLLAEHGEPPVKAAPPPLPPPDGGSGGGEDGDESPEE